MVSKHGWMRPASSGTGEIFSRSWIPQEPTALLIIAHGMAEHSGRYDDFATFMAENGFGVYMNDHAGHGNSAKVQGHFSDKDGWISVVQDLHALRQQAQQQHPDLPVFLMGHSMGSFLSRSYIIRYSEGLSGCVLCGTMGKNPLLVFGRILAKLQMLCKGPQSSGLAIDKLAFGSFNKGIDHPVNKFAWLSSVEQVCLEYAADPQCGFAFTAAGYYDLFSGLKEVTSSKWAEKVPKDLPIYLVAGDKDPVGAYGKGPAQVASQLQNAGCSDITLKLYPDARHEILNETCSQEVYEDILSWLLEHKPETT